MGQARHKYHKGNYSNVCQGAFEAALHSWLPSAVRSPTDPGPLEGVLIAGVLWGCSQYQLTNRLADMYSVRNVPPVVEQVKCEASRVVRNLPDAHGAWQWWRNAHFRKAIQGVVDGLYANNVEGLSDTDLHGLDATIRSVLSLIDLHVTGLGSATHDIVDEDFFRKKTQELIIALEGLQQGLPPDPAKRPSNQELLDRFATLLGKPA